MYLNRVSRRMKLWKWKLRVPVKVEKLQYFFLQKVKGTRAEFGYHNTVTLVALSFLKVSISKSKALTKTAAVFFAVLICDSAAGSNC